MKKLLFCLSVLLLASPLFALNGGLEKWEIAYEGEGYSYREPHMEYPISLKGYHQGASIKYMTAGAGGSVNSLGILEGRFLTGKTDYDGYLWNGTPSTADDITDWYVELRGLYGYKMGNERVSLTPYIGFGYRFLSNNMDKDDSGYRRESTYYYVPIGFSLRSGTDNASIAFTGEFDWLVYGNQYSGLYDGVNNLQEKGFGLRGGIKFSAGSESFNVFVEPFYRFWKIQNSDVVMVSPTNGLLEPFNISREYGIKAGIAF